jgi:sugar lactone lactonase YvrE
VTPPKSQGGVFAAGGPLAIDDAPLSRLEKGTWRHNTASCPSSLATHEPVQPGTTTGTLFVSNFGGNWDLEEFDASGSNQNPIGDFTYTQGAGLRNPYGISVGPDGTLYVASHGNNTVYAFPQGSNNPTLVLDFHNQVLYPIDIAADNQGNVYVVNDRGGPILIFPPGQSVPSQLGGFKYPTQIAFDSSWNLYVVDHAWGSKAPFGAVFKFPPGSTNRTNLGLAKLNFPVGIAIDTNDNIYVSNLGNNTVTQYAPGATTPKRIIGPTTGAVCDPVFLATNSSNVVYVVNNGNSSVTGYKPTAHRPFVTLTKNFADPVGLAVNPNWQPSKNK